MKKIYLKIVFLFVCYIFSYNIAFADAYSKAEKLIRKSQTASIKEEKYDYINAARELYLEKYNENPSDIKALLGLSKTYQLIQDRSEAKLYVLKAYNMKPQDAALQKEMADFYYSFQEYSTAIEYYKLSLASGKLRDFETNLATAKCYEKLGDLKNAELYYKICNHLDSKSKKVMNKLNYYESQNRPDDSQELENAKYKYLFKDKIVPEETKIENEAEDIIENINSFY